METTKLHSGMPVTPPSSDGSNSNMNSPSIDLEDFFDLNDNSKVVNFTNKVVNVTLPTLSTIIDATKSSPRFL